MKRLLALFLLLCLFLSPVLADNRRVIDEADLLTDAEEQKLEQAIALIQEKYQFDIVLLTKESIGQRDGKKYAGDYYDANGYGFGDRHDGVIFLYVAQGDMYGDTVHFTNTGRSERILNNEADEMVWNDIKSDIHSRRFASAFARFIQDMEYLLEADQPLNRANRILPITGIAGVAIGAMVAFILKSQMKSVRRKSDAMSYIRDGSFQLTRQQDIYLYTTTTRRRIETPSSSGGGGSHGSFTGSSGTHHTGHSHR